MCEVTNKNFEELYSSIENALKKSAFISIDCEFSALFSEDKYKISLFDNPDERYKKMKSNLENAVPVEIGITAFLFNRDNSIYTAQPYKFYVFPADFGFITKTFIFQSSALTFLREHNFNFNNFVYSGIPYMNRDQEHQLQQLINEGDLYEYCKYITDSQFENEIRITGTTVSEWFFTKPRENEIILDNINTKNYILAYLTHIDLRNRFPQKIWTYEENSKFKIRRVSSAEYLELSKSSSVEKNLMLSLLGFSKIYKLLVSLRTPLVGHNCINDLLLLINTFDTKLPHSYKSFKKLISTLFPSVFDTKYISFEIKRLIPKEKEWKSNGLGDLYNYFKNETGRHLVACSPLIEIEETFRTYTEDKFHDAGWDAYATGYCFIRMFHIFTVNKLEHCSKKRFLHTEYMKAANILKNRINLIRAATSHINLTGPDPESRRPPCLIIQSKDNKPINIFKLTQLLREYGSVEIKPHSSQGRRVVVAVANHGSVRRILGRFQNHKDFNIMTYSAIKHSPIVRAAIWGGVLSSGGIIFWLLHSHILK